jgi:RNA polymerase sigma factor (sigma-70 family)
MTSASLRIVSRYLSRLAGPVAEAAAAVLLEGYVRSGDADAFARLVERHGPMVLGVCRRVLGASADVEDAFQATFLSLARQARSIRDRDRLAAWVHRVAVRIARKVRSRAAPPPADEPPRRSSDDPAANAAWREVCQVLDEELMRLPEALRAPLVLCYLDGATRDEAAGRLGWSLSTLKRRLERGRELLCGRLTARGIAPAGLAAALVPGGLRAAVPVRLAAAAKGLSVSFGAGAAVGSAVLALARISHRGACAMAPELA